jgi:hypothetical protein
MSFDDDLELDSRAKTTVLNTLWSQSHAKNFNDIIIQEVADTVPHFLDRHRTLEEASRLAWKDFLKNDPQRIAAIQQLASPVDIAELSRHFNAKHAIARYVIHERITGATH